MGISETTNSIDFSYSLVKTKEKAIYELSVTPPKNHHINEKAPHRVAIRNGNGNAPSSVQVLSPDQFKTSESLLKVHLDVSLVNKNTCSIELKIYLCDNANTYCIPKEKIISCEPLADTKTAEEIKNYSDPNNLKKSDEGSKDSSIISTPISSPKNSMFLTDPKLAILKARTENKPLFIDFYGNWCPPCNVLEETVFSHPTFKTYQQKMVFLKLDADLPASWELKSKFQVKGYPTIIFTTPQLEEIQRITGNLEPQNFFSKMNFVIHNKNQSLSTLTNDFQKSKTPTNSWKLLNLYLNQENYMEAFKLVPYAIQKKKLTVREQDTLNYLTLKVGFSSLNKNSPMGTAPEYIDYVKNSLEAFPFEETWYDKLNMLETIAETTKDEDLKKWTYYQTLTITHKLLSQKTDKNNFLTKADLLFMRADSFEKLGAKTEAQYLYKQASLEIEKKIKKLNLNIQTNRGFNLDRVYAIYKSGNFQQANSLYKGLIQIYPNEFTFYYNHAQVLKELNFKEESLAQAKKALEFSYGDNKLRAAYLTADLLKTLNQKPEAIKLLDSIIPNTLLPEDKSIRTHRYYKKLVDLKSEITLSLPK